MSPAGIITIMIGMAILNIGGMGDIVREMFNTNLGAMSTPMSCPYDRATMTIGPIYDEYNPGTELQTEARVYINNMDRGTYQAKDTIDVNYGDRIEVYYGGKIDGMTGEIIEGSYYAEAIMDAPCSSAFSTNPQIVEQVKIFESDYDLDYTLIDTGDLSETSTGVLDLGDLLST